MVVDRIATNLLTPINNVFTKTVRARLFVAGGPVPGFETVYGNIVGPASGVILNATTGLVAIPAGVTYEVRVDVTNTDPNVPFAPNFITATIGVVG